MSDLQSNPQLKLPLFGRINGQPSIVPTAYVTACKTYREAVRLCWDKRRVESHTQRDLAFLSGLRPQFVSDYLNKDDKPFRRDLPAEDIAAFEAVAGNTLVTQWVAARQALTVLEEMQATRALA
jgi:hypothetical protein